MDVKRDFLEILQDYVEFPVAEIDTAAPFKAVSGVDSFVMMEIVNTVEEHFGIAIPNNDLVLFKTVDDIVGYIGKKVAA